MLESPSASPSPDPLLRGEASAASDLSGSTRSVAIVIPAYQAECSVGDVVRRCLALLPEVVVVDDGSTDGTAEEARKAGARVLSHAVNQGKGRALATAFDDLFAAGFDAVITVDADGQHLPEEIPHLLAAWHPDDPERRADLVIGGRDAEFLGMSRLRRTSNLCSSFLISVLAGERITDVQSGFRLYDRRLFETLGITGARFEAESAVVVNAARAGFRLAQVPVRLGFADGRSTSHYRPLVDSLRIARAVVGARLDAFQQEWVR